jgi:CubicO group peptidase (beta-lactamase class C family)
MASYGWIVVSAMIENAAKQPFLQAMRDRVFAPLGMQDTVADTQPKAEDEDFPLVNLFRELFHDPAAARAGTQPAGSATDRVTPYFPRLAANPVYGMHLMRPLDYSCYAGASVFVSTPSDLVRFAMGFPGVLKPHTAALLQSSQKLKSGQETGHGLGWYAKSIQIDGKQTRLVGQDGESLGGMIASLVTLPEHNIAVAVTSNISFADTYTIGLELARTFAAAR